MTPRPELVKMQDYDPDFYTDMNRLEELEGVFTANWWYAKYPNHLSADPKDSSKEYFDNCINGELDYDKRKASRSLK